MVAIMSSLYTKATTAVIKRVGQSLWDDNDNENSGVKKCTFLLLKTYFQGRDFLHLNPLEALKTLFNISHHDYDDKRQIVPQNIGRFGELRGAC
jgi:hypothetical protein